MTNDTLVQARVIRKSRQWSLMWLVPMLALVIASYVGYQAWRTQGHTIVVEFANATGLEPGKTRVRFKDVDVGKVTKIALSEDLSRVLVTIAMDRQLVHSLHEDARFWVVRPRVTTRTISGLSTLLSGAYVAMLPGSSGDVAATYRGLDEPPTLSGASDGRTFFLRADRLGSMDVGSPVFYRGIAVGEVVSYTLGHDDRMKIQVFIRSPYDRLVKTQTRFWNVNGIDISVSSDGVKAQMESLLSFMQGGLAFENVQSLDAQSPVANDHVFALYPSKDSVDQTPPNLALTYVMMFEGSVAGLTEGARVLHQGLEVGRVLDVSPRFDAQTLKVRIPVLVALWPERMAMPNDATLATKLLQNMMQSGLRAQLKPANLLTGQILVDLAYQEKPSKWIVAHQEGHELFPTIPSDLDNIMRTVGGVMTQLEKAPLAEMVSSLNETAKGLRRMLDERKQDSVLRQTEALLKQANDVLASMKGIPSTLDTTLVQTQKTLATLDASLKSANHALAEDSLVQHDMRSLMQEVARAATAVETLADSLQRQPNAVIFGKE